MTIPGAVMVDATHNTNGTRLKSHVARRKDKKMSKYDQNKLSTVQPPAPAAAPRPKAKAPASTSAAAPAGAHKRQRKQHVPFRVGDNSDGLAYRARSS